MKHVSAADWLVVAAFLVALVALVAFVVGYVVSSRGDWRRTAEGRHMVNFRSALATLMSVSILHNLVPAYPGRDVVRVLVVSWLAVGAVQGCLLLYRAQRARRRLKGRP